MSTRNPLSIARALGSARHGSDHWWVQRLTAVALVPLTFWLAAATVSLVDADHATFTAWIATPGRAVGVLLFIFATFYHLKLGLQVVIEDYVRPRSATVTMLILNVFFCVLLGTACAFAVLKLAIGG